MAATGFRVFLPQKRHLLRWKSSQGVHLAAVSAWNLPPLEQKSAWKSSCQQTLGCQTAKGYLKIDFPALPKLGKNDMLFINREMGFQQLAKFQVAFLLPVLFTFAPHASAGTFFSLLRQRKESKRKATAGTGLASPNFPHSTRFFGRARHLRLRRFEHASPCSPKNRAPFGCASRGVASSIG